MNKYTPLTHHLAARSADRIAMTFADLEAVLGFPLPPSARKHRAWWSNNAQNSVATRAWIDAGYRSRDVDLAAERLMFERLNRVEAGGDATRHPLFGLFAGQVWIDPDWDPTEPALPDWPEIIDTEAERFTRDFK